MLFTAVYFLIALGFSFSLTPLVRKFAQQHHMVATENHRTLHRGRVPKFGGAAIAIAFAAGIAAISFLQNDYFMQNIAAITSLLFCSLVIFTLGSFDDRFDLNCNLKLLVELLAAFVVVYFGWRMEALVLPNLIRIELGWLSYPVSIFWIVGLANAINLIDGLDGLAGGVVVMTAIINIAVALIFQNVLAITLAVILIGAVLGFLRYNLNPARIFMGDSGSLMLGFLTACISLNAASVTPGSVILAVPVLLLALPITDTVLAIIRRLRRGIHPFHADREHIHHRLVNLGLSQAGAAMCMVGLSCLLGILAFLVAKSVYTDIRLLSLLP
ncbi:undecaprenyl/decaprenyl-phosphate alpha-N-acetylglucosaminyl 1-phosphate transferase [candidate division KSB1 bacterium]|nr:undecaprenyl/decaprenyl-phosphate alpha-N-acetylglucosaminyl 1-phosphate transferase [candidate division KSB1 bacterium]